MTKSNGIKSLKQAAKLLNKHAPDGESLAYINPAEGHLLKAHGGSGIQTLAGVPSYIDWGDLWKGIKKVGSNILGRYTDKEHGGENVIKDLASLGGGYVGWQESKDLSDFQKKQYEKQLAEEALNEMWFAQQTDEGKQLLTPTNVPSTIEDVSTFSEVDIPTMKTTAAHGGRIGYNFGGIGALNPRMGYQNAGEVENFNWGGPDVVETANMGEEILFNKPLWNRDIQALEREQTREFDEIVRQDLMKRVMKYIRDAGGSYKVPERSYWEALSKATEAGDEDVIEYLSQSLYGYPKRVAKQEMSMGAAYGGRIGAQGGGIMPLLDMGGMEKDYRQDGGFVPIGRKEKADDVPARLSKNEFVFTADAVRAAGGGDIDQGAQRMYNVMKNLEAGGEISEQSQGKA